MNYHEIEKSLAWHFHYMDELADHLQEWMESKHLEVKEEVDRIREGYDPEIVERAWEEGYTTKRDHERLEQEDPERAKELEAQMRKRIALLLPSVEYQMTGVAFPFITWSALVVMALSHFEGGLRTICLFIATETEDVEWLKRKKTYVAHYQSYIGKHSSFDFGSGEWDEYRIHQKVRNFLVHYGGALDDSDNARLVRDYAKAGESGIIIDANGGLFIQKAYAKRVIKQLWDLLIEMGQSLKLG